MRQKTKFEKGILVLFMAPEIIAITAMIVSGLIYFFLKWILFSCWE